MLLADKARPKSLSQLDYHDSLTEKLQALANREDIPHLLFYGPSGAGLFPCSLSLFFTLSLSLCFLPPYSRRQKDPSDVFAEGHLWFWGGEAPAGGAVLQEQVEQERGYFDGRLELPPRMLSFRRQEQRCAGHPRSDQGDCFHGLAPAAEGFFFFFFPQETLQR